MEFDTGNEEFKLRLDTTLKYSAAARLQGRSPNLSRTISGPAGVVGPNNLNQDDGDNNFDRGLVSNRLDMLGELDARYRNFGARVSAAAWYDTVYNQGTDNTSSSSNHIPANEFPSDTRKFMGRRAEILDAFVSGKFAVADTDVTVRLGRHTLLWGESLFFGANGIAGGQAPTDLIKVQSVPNSQFKETARPTGKLSGQAQVSSNLSVGAYLGYEWEGTRLMPVGAYLSGSDIAGPGGERLYAGTSGAWTKAGDIQPSNFGHGGVQLRMRAPSIDTDFGLYAIRFHALTPSNIYNTLSGTAPALTARTTRFAYHEGIRAFGASVAKTVGMWSLAAETSVRQNAPLASVGRRIVSADGMSIGFDNDHNPGYAVGRTAHAQFSWLASLGPNWIANESSFNGEIAWNKRLSVGRNVDMLNPNADVSATSMRVVYSATYRQVVPGLDLTPSIGASYTWGNSSAIGPSFGVNKGGDYSIGLAANYLGSWTAAVNLVGFHGPEGSQLDNAGNAQFKQALKDRRFISVSLRNTF
jgi:hypothetical protein